MPERPAAGPATPAAGLAGATGTPGPGEQAPQAPRRRALPVAKTAPSHRLRPGDLICGACGEGNPPVRKFCSRCGDSLVQAEVVRTPWWKKLLPRRGPKVVAAGPGPRHGGAPGADVRHGLRRVYRIVRTVLAIVLVGAGIAYGLIPPLRTAVNSRLGSAKAHVSAISHPKYVPVHPVSEVASAHSPGHPGQLAVDEFTNTYWLVPWNPAHEPTLTLKFSSKIILREVILHNGASDNYVTHGRPASLHLVFSNQQSDTITPQDTSKPQTLTISHATGVTSVEIQIASIYQGTSPDVAITEIELFALQP